MKPAFSGPVGRVLSFMEADNTLNMLELDQVPLVVYSLAEFAWYGALDVDHIQHVLSFVEITIGVKQLALLIYCCQVSLESPFVSFLNPFLLLSFYPKSLSNYA